MIMCLCVWYDNANTAATDDDDDDDDDDNIGGLRRVLVEKYGAVRRWRICRVTNLLLFSQIYLPHTPDLTVDLHWFMTLNYKSVTLLVSFITHVVYLMYITHQTAFTITTGDNSFPEVVWRIIIARKSSV